jgi:hypothetical protein
MRAHRMGERLHVRGCADVVPPFEGRFAIHEAFAPGHANGFQPFPFFGIGQGVQARGQVAAPGPDAAMPGIGFGMGL